MCALSLVMPTTTQDIVLMQQIVLMSRERKINESLSRNPSDLVRLAFRC